MPERSNKIYSATYSNVPVYEYNVSGNHIMRRRSDDWINATHILKVAEHDKPARTRILEREVQKGVHEKVQGGYGKYQGTWIPLEEGRLLAEKNGVLEKLLPIFDFVPGDRSPPPAPKHATASSNKPKVPKAPAVRKAPVKAVAPPQRSQMSDVSHEAYSTHETPDRASMASESDVDMMRNSSQYTNNSQHRKRKRNVEEPETMSYQEQQHLMWTDELLDYFMLQNSNDPLPAPPEPPQSIDLNRPVDDKGHTPMHWAAAMADLHVVRDLLARGARIDSAASNGETPLMRAVLFTNNYDKQIMDRLVQIFQSTVHQKDYCMSTVFHHIVATTCSKSKYQCARYYLDTVLDRITGSYTPQQIAHLLDTQDQNGDTAIIIAARNGARKCVRTLLDFAASVTIANNQGQTAKELIEMLNARRRERYGLQSLNVTSSSPVRGGDGNRTVGAAPRSSVTLNHQHNSSTASALQGGLQTTNNMLPSSATATPRSLRHLPGPAAKKQKMQTYQSEAAQLLTSQLPVLISSRTEALAAALETELMEREVEVAEGERVLVTRRQDLAELKARREALAEEEAQRARDGVVNGADFSGGTRETEESQQKQELEALEAEARQLIEAEQAQEIARLVAEARSQYEAEDSGIGMLANGKGGMGDDTDGDDTMPMEERLRLARAVAEQQTRHAQLINELLAAQATASISASDSSSGATQQNGKVNGGTGSSGGKQALYKRLITAALGVATEDVEAMLPEMLRELEDARRDRAAGAAAAASATASMLTGAAANAGRGPHDNDGDIGMANSSAIAPSATGAAGQHRGGYYGHGHGHTSLSAREGVHAAA